jgi:hypothetical protein
MAFPGHEQTEALANCMQKMVLKEVLWDLMIMTHAVNANYLGDPAKICGITNHYYEP